MSRWCQILLVFVFALGFSLRVVAGVLAHEPGEPEVTAHAAMAHMAASGDMTRAGDVDACAGHAMHRVSSTAGPSHRASAVALHGGHLEPTPSTTSHQTCSPVCGTCCIGAVLPPSPIVTAAAEQVRIAKQRPQSALPPSFLTGGIERPPRFVLV